jgi:hypothetical protein
VAYVGSVAQLAFLLLISLWSVSRTEFRGRVKIAASAVLVRSQVHFSALRPAVTGEVVSDLPQSLQPNFDCFLPNSLPFIHYSSNYPTLLTASLNKVYFCLFLSVEQLVSCVQTISEHTSSPGSDVGHYHYY